MGETLSSTSEGQPSEMETFREPPRVQRDPRVRSLLEMMHGPPKEHQAERERPGRSALEAGYVRLSARRRAGPSAPPNSQAASGVEETDEGEANDPRNIKPLLIPPGGSSDGSSTTLEASKAGTPRSQEPHRLYECGRCKAFFSKRDQMHHHAETAHPRYRAKCIQCQRYWGSQRELAAHQGLSGHKGIKLEQEGDLDLGNLPARLQAAGLQ